MDKIISFFTKNILWKITALIMAVILWIIAINIEDPMESKTYYSIPLELRNIDVLETYNLVLLNKEELERRSVAVRVWANNRLLNTQLSSGNIKAYIDFGPVSFSFMDRIGQTLTPPVEIELPSFAETVRNYVATPATVGIVLDRLITKAFPITVVKTSEPGYNYVSMEPIASPAAIKITGAQSIVDMVNSVRLEVSLSGATSDYTAYGSIAVYDSENNNITSRVSVDYNQAQVFVPINRLGQIPIITPEITGIPADGYIVTSVDTDIKYVDVVGKQEDLSNLSGIRLDAVDVTGMSETAVIQRDVRDSLRQTKLSVRNGRPHEVNITVTLEKEIVREFSIPVSNFEILGDNDDITYESHVSISLRGLDRILSRVDPNSISGIIDLEGYEVGVHEVFINLDNIPEGVSLVSERPSITVTVILPEEPEEYEYESEPEEDEFENEEIQN